MLIPVLALWLAQAEPELSPEQKQVQTLVARIRRLAASEPAVYGVDTRLRLADALLSKDPKLARESLRDAEASLNAVLDEADQERLRIRTVELLAHLDIDEAERLIASIRRERAHDYVAQAYDRLYQALDGHPAEARKMVSKGLAAGAFRLVSAARLLEGAAAGEEGARLYAEILGVFPAASPSSEDILYLLQQTRMIAKSHRQLAVEGAMRAVQAAASSQVAEAQRRISQDAAKLLGELDPELLERYRREHPAFAAASKPDDAPKKAEEKKDDDSAPDLSGFSYSDALSQARKLENPATRWEALVTLSRREDLTSQQRTTVASEALAIAASLSVPDERLTAFAIVSRDYARRGELARAGLAAQLLLENYNKVCDCPTWTCGQGANRVECVDDVQSFAEYLDEFKITPESMSLDNISLESRLLVLKLRAVGKKPDVH